MDPALYKKAVEHNEEGRRLKNRLSQLALIICPLLLVLGCLLFAFPAKFRPSYPQGIMGDFWYDKTASALIILGLYFPYLSIRWLLKNRNTDRV